MAKITELIDSLNDENASEVKEQLKAEADTLAENNKQLFARAKKAEGFEQDSEGKWVKVEKPQPPEAKPEEKKPNEPDYLDKIDKLTLKSEGISHPDDQKIVLAEAKRLNLSVEEIVGMEHIKAKLKTASEQREAEAGMPDGKGKPSGTNKSSVEYWVDKKNPDGTYKTPDDPELATKVIDARVHKEEVSSMFDEIRV
jgi:hypothetical protein